MVDSVGHRTVETDGPIGPPILNISDGRGNLLPDAPERLSALLRFPNDETKQKQSLADIHEGAVALFEKHIESGHARALEEAIASARQIRTGIRLQRSRIYASSSEYRIGIVASLLILALNSPPKRKLGLQGARRLLAQINARVKDRDGHRIAGDEKYMKAAWRVGQCVAHLCAALALWQAWRERPEYRLFELLDQGASTSPSRAIFDPGSLETLPNFLAAADALRLAGEAHLPGTGRGGVAPGRLPFLDASKTFRPPADLILPLVGVRPSLSLPSRY